jgi:putative PIN family toxin of toxin-antitoxin system
VLDTNVFISGIFWHKASFQIIQKWRLASFTLVITPQIMAEVLTKLDEKFAVPPPLVQKWRRLLLRRAVVVIPRVPVSISRDPKDNMILEAALAGRATHMVSGDADLLSLHDHRGIPIVTPRQFVETLETQTS